VVEGSIRRATAQKYGCAVWFYSFPSLVHVPALHYDGAILRLPAHCQLMMNPIICDSIIL